MKLVIRVSTMASPYLAIMTSRRPVKTSLRFWPIRIVASGKFSDCSSIKSRVRMSPPDVGGYRQDEHREVRFRSIMSRAYLPVDQMDKGTCQRRNVFSLLRGDVTRG